MKFILLSLLVFSNVATAAAPFCESALGAFQTLKYAPNPEDTEKLKKDYKDISEKLSKLCVELQTAGIDEEAISFKILQQCNTLVRKKFDQSKVDEAAMAIRYEATKPCRDSGTMSSFYYDGLSRGIREERAKVKAEVKTCESKTAVSDLSRTVKNVEQQISNSPEASTKVIDK